MTMLTPEGASVAIDIGGPGGRSQSLLAGWGNMPVVHGYEIRSESLEHVTRNATLTRGLGRAYGDAALPATGDFCITGTALADRVISFDSQDGMLCAEAGLSLEHLYRLFLPRGYFTPVSPGTRYVTLGGMVASDVHGKNHHRDGTFGQHVISVSLRVADGSLVTCSRTENPDLFRATIGGMGLTGHILTVTVRLTKVPSPWLLQDTEPVNGIAEFIDALRRAAGTWPMTAGWIDCLSKSEAGRGVLFKGRWAEPGEGPDHFPDLARPHAVPFPMPNATLSPQIVRMFNWAYYRRGLTRKRRSIVSPGGFFYPLDVIGNWNRLYGRRGFVQCQCVLPDDRAEAGAQRLLEVVARAGGTPYLGVIKDCGPEGIGILSFPMSGISIALDFQMRDDIQSLVDRMNEVVIDYGGRVYLAKDALTRPEHFRAMEPRLAEFLRIRRDWDPRGRIRSALSVRLFGW